MIQVTDRFTNEDYKFVSVVKVEKRGRGIWYVFDDGTELIHTALMFKLSKKIWRKA